MDFNDAKDTAITVSIRDNRVVVDGVGYTVNFDDEKYKALDYDLVSWNNGSAGFTQAFPGIRVKTFKGTEAEYNQFVAQYVTLWEAAKAEAEAEAEKAAEAEAERLAIAQKEADIAAVDRESIGPMRTLLIALAAANGEACAECKEALEALKAAEDKVASLQSELEQMSSGAV